MLKKLSFKASDFLILLILFHLIGNIVWIKLNNAPPPWDQASHTRFSLLFGHFFNKLYSGKIDSNIFSFAFTDNYGPFLRLTTGFLMSLVSLDIKLAQTVGTIFLVLSFIMIYKLSNEIYKNEWVSLLTVFMLLCLIFSCICLCDIIMNSVILFLSRNTNI